MWSLEITWQTKSIMFPQLHCLWPTHLVGWWLTLRVSYHYSHLILKSRSLAWSRDKLETICLYYCNTYGHQTWQGDDIWRRASTHIVKNFISPKSIDQWLPNMAKWWLSVRVFHPAIHITLPICAHERSHDNLKTLYPHYHNAYSHKTYLGGDILQLVAINSHDPSMRLSCEITWQVKYIISPPVADPWTPN